MIGWAQRVMVNGFTSGCQPITSGVPPGSVLKPVLFNVSIHYQNAGVECTLSKFASDIKLGENLGYLEGREVLQRDLDIPENWAIPNHLK